ncbi:MAG: class II aldolase/adducin family protein, partial [Myxococcales bacterium]|nr:class II aldolase/adducin family protein [Myxococcales bacterium]
MAESYTERGAAEAVAAWGGVAGEDLALRTYTSRLIGSDPGLVLHGGGNTSVKGTLTDLLGTPSEVLWVKGSGWDLATIEPAGFAPVDLPYVRRLRALPALSDEDMVDVLKTRTLSSTAPRPSIETLLHAFLPHRFVDHSHADAILALTNRADGEALVRRVLGPTVALVPYVKAGFDLAKLAADVFDAHPDCEGLVLLHHGLFTFGETAEESFRRHVELVQRAEAHLAEATPSMPAEARSGAAAPAGRVAGWVRGALTRGSSRAPVLAHRDDPALLGALRHARVDHWANTGPLTPDHVIRTKATPLLLRSDPHGPAEVVAAEIRAAVDDYVQRYEAYFEACAGADAQRYTRLDPSPRVVWWPGVGLFASGETAAQARIVADLACHTLLTKQRAAALGPYVGLSDQHLFDMEYWSLEQAKLGRSAPPVLGRRVALVTG